MFATNLRGSGQLVHSSVLMFNLSFTFLHCLTVKIVLLKVYFSCRNVIDEAAKVLRNAAGNYYVNDKSTGSIVAQQPFGGARSSGKSWFYSLNREARVNGDCLIVSRVQLFTFLFVKERMTNLEGRTTS